MAMSQLDPGQIIKTVYDSATEAVRVTGSLTFAEEATVADGGALPSEVKVIGGYDGSVVQAIKTDADGNLQVDVLSSALPSGAATEATLADIEAGIPEALGQAAMAASMPVVIASDQSAVPVSATNLDIRDLTSASDSVAAVQSGSWSVTVLNPTLDVIDFFDTPVLDASSSNIPASGSSPLEVVASLAAAVKKIKINDTTGEFLGVYTGAAASEVLQCVVGPGEDGVIEVAMSAGQRVSVRNMANSAISVGSLCIQFLG